ncbi:hypothetical protein YC2023_115588 [Brassica napus]
MEGCDHNGEAEGSGRVAADFTDWLGDRYSYGRRSPGLQKFHLYCRSGREYFSLSCGKGKRDSIGPLVDFWAKLDISSPSQCK